MEFLKILVGEDVENDNKEWQGPMGDNDEIMGSNEGWQWTLKRTMLCVGEHQRP
jgi:hypothetical protein